MRTGKRILVLFGEIGVLILGFSISIALGAIVGALIWPNQILSEVILFCGLLGTIGGFLAARRRTMACKLEYAAARWELGRVERERHPQFLKWKGLIYRALICAPSAIALLVLFFFPVASHLLQPRSHYLKHYRLPIPWTVTVFSWKWPSNDLVITLAPHRRDSGFTPFWERDPISSEMTFASTDSTDDLSEDGYSGNQVYSKQLRVGVLPLFCSQSRRGHSGHILFVHCGTSREAGVFNFRASFAGAEDDLPLFYSTIEGVRPLP